MRLHMRRHARQQLLLDLQVLRHRLDDPVALRKRGEVVLEVAGANARCGSGRVERRRLALLQRIQRLCPQRHCARHPSRRQVQQQHADTGIRQMRRDARSHRARAQHRGFAQQQRLADARFGQPSRSATASMLSSLLQPCM